MDDKYIYSTDPDRWDGTIYRIIECGQPDDDGCGLWLYKPSPDAPWKCPVHGRNYGSTHFRWVHPFISPVVPGSEAPTAPLSQKILGLRALRNSFGYSSVLQIIAALPVQDEEGIKAYPLSQWPSGVFARPCPVRPRHGFVDSKLITTSEELVAMREAVLAVEPEGWIMITPAYKAISLNAIWTPLVLTVGKGNDGATAGKDVISFPLSGKNPLPLSLIEKSGIGEGEGPYIEVIYSSDTADAIPDGLLTQLRAGPALGGRSPNYLPSPITVEEIIKVTGQDLVEWEGLMASVKGRPGIVIYHPGGSMTDHYAVHARQNEIPLLTTIVPEIGMILTPSDGPPADPDPRAVLKGIMAVDLMRTAPSSSDLRTLTRLMLGGLHHSSFMEGEDGKWIGAAAALMLKLGSLALRGEARHFGPGGKTGSSIQRHQVYEAEFTKSLSHHRMNLKKMMRVFRYYGKWKGTSYGGEKWAACTLSLEPLFKAVRALAMTPDKAHVQALVMALNVAINQAHNGGWWMNKFTEQSDMDLIQRGALMATIGMAPAISTVAGSYEQIDSTTYHALRGSYKGWPEDQLKGTIQPQKVNMKLVPDYLGRPSLCLTLYAPHLHKDGMHLTIPPSRLTKLALTAEELRENTYWYPDKHGGYVIKVGKRVLYRTPSIPLITKGASL